ncbi:MAG: tRNA preQ1(34) S-adenosylmethionine ribosyltransferase-isomerase QueA, partial [Gemmatimonadales bacterium]
MKGEHRFRTADFHYDLPDDLIAQRPASQRTASRLLVVHRESPAGVPALEDRNFPDLADLISPGDCLVLNTTRVRHARLIGTRASGAAAELLLIHPAQDGTWIVLGKPGKALRPGRRIRFGDEAEAETIEVFPDGNRRVRFTGKPVEEIMVSHGRLPLPPYITHDPDQTDEERYQTVYAEREGSVAAPTAGLHFTPELLARIEGNGVTVARIDLEVGPGTFKPVEVEDPAGHPMHPEHYTIPEEAAEQIAAARSGGGRIWAVGTTVVRALESSAADAGVQAGAATTRLLITPGFRFRVVDRLVTNFHLPRSTLLM